MFAAVVVTVAHSFSLLFYHCVHRSYFQPTVFVLPSEASKNSIKEIIILMLFLYFPRFPSSKSRSRWRPNVLKKITNKQMNMWFAGRGAKVFLIFWIQGDWRVFETFLVSFICFCTQGHKGKGEGEEKRTDVRWPSQINQFPRSGTFLSFMLNVSKSRGLKQTIDSTFSSNFLPCSSIPLLVP